MSCLPDGVIRAFLDRELAPEVLADAAAHLAGCSECSARLETVSARALRVSALLDLPQPVLTDCRWTGPRPARPVSRRLFWVPAAAAAAVLALAISFWGSRHERAPSPIPTASLPAPEPEAPAPAAAKTSDPAPRRTSPRRPVARQRLAVNTNQSSQAVKREIPYFLRLDDEPFEYGPVVRVGLGPAGIPADVIFSPDGRPRAIRLASFVLQGEEQ